MLYPFHIHWAKPGSFLVGAGIFMIRGLFVGVEQAMEEAESLLLLVVVVTVIGIHIYYFLKTAHSK